MSNTKTNGQNGQNGHGADETGPLFNVHNIYLKDISFEAPHSPQIFQEEWKPKIDFDLQMGSSILSETESIFEVLLHVTISVKLGEAEHEKTTFLVDIKQAGIFTIKNMPEDTVKQILATTCPTVLFPYVRETVSNLASKGGFPQMVLPPLNFDAMYAQHLTSQGGEGSKEGKIIS